MGHRGEKQVDIIQATGIPRSTFSRCIREEHAFDVDQLGLIADHFGISLAELLDVEQRAS